MFPKAYKRVAEMSQSLIGNVIQFQNNEKTDIIKSQSLIGNVILIKSGMEKLDNKGLNPS